MILVVALLGPRSNRGRGFFFSSSYFSKKTCVRLKERKKEKKINDIIENIYTYIYIKLDRYGNIYIVESNSQPLEGDGIREESEERGRNERKSERRRRETFRKG